MSKKNLKINLSTMSENAVALLSGYSVAVVALKKLSDAHKAESDRLTANIAELLKEVEEGKKLGTLTPERSEQIAQLITTLNMKKMQNDEQFKEDKKPYTAAKKAALVMVPENIYDGYVKAWEGGSVALWNVDICAFLRATGIDTSDDVRVQNFANIMKVFIDHCVVEKGVLDRAEDGTITRHCFE